MLLDILVYFPLYLICSFLGWKARRWYYRALYGSTSHWRRVSRRIRSQYTSCPVRGCTRTKLTVHHMRYQLWFERERDLVALCWGHHLQVENGDDVKLKDGKIVKGYRKWK